MNKANPINLENQSASRGVLSPIAGKKQLLPHSYASDAKGKTGFYRIIKAAGYSLDGFKAAYKFEAAFRQVFWLNLILFMAIILCLSLSASKCCWSSLLSYH